MAPPSWLAATGRARRFLEVSAIATSNVYKCFNGLEQFMLAPPAFLRESWYKCFDDHENVEPEMVQVPAWQAYSSGVPVAQPQEEAEGRLELEPDDLHTENTLEDEGQLIDSQFGPIGSQSHRYVSEHKGGPLPRLPIDAPAYFYLLTTYISYIILIAVGLTRDFFGKRFKPEQYRDFKERDGYAALNSDFDNFFFRRLKARIDDCFMRPYGSSRPGNVALTISESQVSLAVISLSWTVFLTTTTPLLSTLAPILQR